MAAWNELAKDAPEIAEKGRALFYQTGGGKALLATVRDDLVPRVHPITIEVRDGGIYAFILSSGKPTDLEQDGRYGLHAFMDAAVPNEFVVGGRVRRVEGEEQDRLAREWSWDVGDAAAFEFMVDEAILGERASDDDWPPHYSTWRAER